MTATAMWRLGYHLHHETLSKHTMPLPQWS